MKKILSAFFVLILGNFLTLQAQSTRFGFSINPGFSYISKQSRLKGDESGGMLLSGNTGFLMEIDLRDNCHFGLEFVYVYVRYLESYLSVKTQGANGTVINENKRTLWGHKIGLPLYFRYGGRHFAVKAGLQGLYNLYHGEKTVLSGSSFNEPFRTETTLSFEDYKSVDIGSKFGIDVGLSKRLRLRADYYMEWATLNGTDYFNFVVDQKYRQVTLGLTYFFQPAVR